MKFLIRVSAFVALVSLVGVTVSFCINNRDAAVFFLSLLGFDLICILCAILINIIFSE